MATSKSVTNKTTLVKIDSPKQVATFAKELKQFIVTNKLYSSIRDKNFVHVEGWQFAAASMGYFFVPVSVERLDSDPKVYKYQSTVELIRISDGIVVGRGFALCSSEEPKKKSFDEYAVYSMAQTRAIGKAGRNTLGWVMKLAGYEATPSEEVDETYVVSDDMEPPVVEADTTSFDDIKTEVTQRLAKLPTHEKMRLLKTVGKLNDKDLTEGQIRQLWFTTQDNQTD